MIGDDPAPALSAALIFLFKRVGACHPAPAGV